MSALWLVLEPGVLAAADADADPGDVADWAAAEGPARVGGQGREAALAEGGKVRKESNY